MRDQLEIRLMKNNSKMFHTLCIDDSGGCSKDYSKFSFVTAAQRLNVVFHGGGYSKILKIAYDLVAAAACV